MDNLDSVNFGNQNLNEPIPLDKDLDKPIPFDDVGTSETSVSHSPLDLGGSSTAAVPKIKVPEPVAKKPAEKIASTDRIAGVKTFFTKLHAGSIDFLNQQIINWLKENPGVSLKLTNTTTGDVVGKKTEPNLVITVWY